MKIRTTLHYKPHWAWCVVGLECSRHYCSVCRMLYRTCQSVKTWEGDRDVVGGLREGYTGACPRCDEVRWIQAEIYDDEREATHHG